MDSKTQALINQLVSLYGSTETALVAALLRDAELEEMLFTISGIMDKLDLSTASKVQNVVHRVVTYETRLAERRMNGSNLTISQEAMNAITSRFYATFAQQNAEIRQTVVETVNRGWSRGASLEDRRSLQKAVRESGIIGLKRSDGSELSIRATGKAMVRTRVNQLQAETQLSRYRTGKVEKVKFVAGGYCTFAGEGGTCTGLDGREFPIDDIPDWAQIPRHLYSNSRWLPVLDS